MCKLIKLSLSVPRSFKHLCRTPGIIQLLSNLSVKYNIAPLLQSWLARLVPLAMAQADTGSYSASEGSDDFGQGPPMYASLLGGALAELDLNRDVVLDITRWEY